MIHLGTESVGPGMDAGHLGGGGEEGGRGFTSGGCVERGFGRRERDEGRDDGGFHICIWILFFEDVKRL